MSTPQTNNKVYLETFGCQMNVLDSELVAGQLRAAGYKIVPDADSADVLLYNTCSVRQAAEDKVEARLGDAKRFKRERPGLIVGVIGCMAERDGESMLERQSAVDIMCGPGELDKVPLLIDNAVKTGQPAVALAGSNNRRSSTLDAAKDELELVDLSRSVSPTDHNGSAYVRITRGCNKFCTYCVVPFTRGAEIHRPPDHIVEEVRKLADAGVIEVTLLGQTVNHYRYDHGAAVSSSGVQQPQVGPGGGAFRNPENRFNVGRSVTTFAQLVRRVHDEVPEIKRLRFVTSYPRDFGDDVLEMMANSQRVCRYLHLPVQSGSDRILKLMNREYTAAEYVELIDRARHFMPDVTIASDFIVGFPTETDEDHKLTAKLIERCRFKNSFIFKYSPRPGTLAIDKLPDDIPESIKKRRNAELLDLQVAASQAVSDEQLGQTLEVMVEGISHKAKRRLRQQTTQDTEPNPANDITNPTPNPAAAVATASPVTAAVTEREVIQLSGRTRGDLIVMFEGPESLVGQLVNVKIHRARPLTLFGALVDQ